MYPRTFHRAMQHLKLIRDPEAFQLLGDETRRKIIFLLCVKSMTVSQMAAELNLTPQAVYHHIKKLLNTDLVEVEREERVGHLIESYYQATAESFMFHIGPLDPTQKVAQDQVRNVLHALQRLGFSLKFSDEDITRLLETQSQMTACCGTEEYVDQIAKMDDIDFFTKQTIEKYAETLTMSDEDFLEQQKLQVAFRQLLRSLLT
jgi:DNA-binding transcriptional ArsR family regulator